MPKKELYSYTGVVFSVVSLAVFLGCWLCVCFVVWVVFVVLMFVAICVCAGDATALRQVIQGDQAGGQEAPGVGGYF